jgi:hypothetical protein
MNLTKQYFINIETEAAVKCVLAGFFMVDLTGTFEAGDSAQTVIYLPPPAVLMEAAGAVDCFSVEATLIVPCRT